MLGQLLHRQTAQKSATDKAWPERTRMLVYERFAELGLTAGLDDNSTEAGPGWKKAALILHDPRLRIPVFFYAILMTLFALERLAILFTGPEVFANTSVLQLIRTFLVGARFDTVAALMLIIPLAPVIIMTPGKPPHLWCRKVVVRYCATVLGLALFACVVDFAFFMQFAERLNWKAIEYLGYDYVYSIIRDKYPVALVLALTAAIIILSPRPLDRLFFVNKR